MCRLQREGKIRLWGVSNLDVKDMEIIEELPNGCGCDANQVLTIFRSVVSSMT